MTAPQARYRPAHVVTADPPARTGRRSLAMMCATAIAALALAACGGGSDDGDDDVGTTPPPPAGPTTAARAAAAKATAESASNDCAAIRPFYWEVGDTSGALAAGSTTSTVDPTVYTASTEMPIASASKWLYSTYVVERQNGALTATDVKFLTFTSGYTSFAFCLPGQTVQGCVDFAGNGDYTAADDGRFAYGGGHMEKHAATNGLGALTNAPLAAELRSRLGADVALAYAQPQLAGGAVTSAADYARVLRRILSGGLKMKDALGTHAVCTNPVTCPTAVNAPVPSTESWSYSIGHWVETDPVVGDGAFSSAGAFGFYPWIDAGKTSYGIVARRVDGGAIDSVRCGRIVRKAWQTAVAQ